MKHISFLLALVLCMSCILCCNEALLNAENAEVEALEHIFMDGYWITENDSARIIQFKFRKNHSGTIYYLTDDTHTEYDFHWEILSIDELKMEEQIWIIQSADKQMLILQEKNGDRLYLMSKTYIGPY